MSNAFDADQANLKIVYGQIASLDELTRRYAYTLCHQPKLEPQQRVTLCENMLSMAKARNEAVREATALLMSQQKNLKRLKARLI